jgi:hypothetical protein
MTKTTIQEQKSKGKKSYDELLADMRAVWSNTGIVFIPKLCDALKEERPEFSNKQIEEKIYLDCEGIWVRSYIHACLPSWIHNQKKVIATKKQWEKRYANAIKVADKISANLAQVQIPESKMPEPENDESVDQEMHELGLAKFGETDKSIRELKGEISHYTAMLFKALTLKDIPRGDSEDLMVEYIKPSREFRRSLVLELDETDKTIIHNWLHYVSLAIEDMIEIMREK